MTCILVVRPQPAADETAALLRTEGIDAFAAPVSEYIELPFDPPDLSLYQAIAFTSPAGVRAFSGRAGLPAFCVGDATAAAALAAGFADVRSADGDALGLAALIATAGPRRVLHLSGIEVARDMTPLLAEKGIVLDRVAVYALRLLDELPPDAAAAIDEGQAGAALLFSARAAARFVSLLPPGALGNMTALCLSPRIAAAAGTGWAAVRVAERPRTDAMTALVRAFHI